MDTQHRPFRREGLGRAPDMRRNDQAFKPAPGIADPEMLQPIDKGGDRRLGSGFQDQSEQAAGARKILLPQGMTGIAFQGGVQDAGDLGPGLQPTRQGEGGLLMPRQAYTQGAQAAQSQEAVIATGIKAQIAVQ